VVLTGQYSIKIMTKNTILISFGLYPRRELVSYLGPELVYNTEKVQRPDMVICGHLCLYWLKSLSGGKKTPGSYKYVVLMNE